MSRVDAVRREATKRLRYHLLHPFLARLPPRAGYRLATALGARRWHDGRAEWREYARGLRAAYPTLDAPTIARLGRWHTGMLAREMTDVFLLPRLNPTNLHTRIDLTGLETLREAQAEGRGVILCMGHYGRPIMLSTALGLSRVPVGILTQRLDARNALLSAADRAYLRVKVRHTLAAAGGRWITAGDNLRELHVGLRAGEPIIVMYDLLEPNLRRRFSAPFLGGVLSVPDGTLRLARKTRARLVYGVARDAGWRVEAELRPLPEDPAAALTAAIAELERDVTRHPAQWWQWGVMSLFWTPASP